MGIMLLPSETFSTLRRVSLIVYHFYTKRKKKRERKGGDIGGDCRVESNQPRNYGVVGDIRLGDALLGAVANQEPSHQHPVVNPHEIARLFPGGSVPIRVPSCKLPRGRRLVGEHAVYDVDLRLHGETQPQLEVTPITKYGSDPQLLVGRQIAVNKVYICYGLKGGNIRVLNINTALRALFRGHSQRVTDMAFFAEDVHLLVSVSLDGKVFVWKVSEGSEGDDQPQITGSIVLALQILGEEDTKHPRICWHCHKQELLVVSIGKHVLRIDTTKVSRGEVFSAEAPLQCPLDKLIDGVQIVGKQDGEVTDLSMCQWMTTRLVSSSVDGMVCVCSYHFLHSCLAHFAISFFWN